MNILILDCNYLLLLKHKNESYENFDPNDQLFAVVFSCITEISSQVKVTSNNNVGVGTDNPHSSAKLEVHSENQGFLKPRMTTSQRNAINNPSVGLEVLISMII